MKKKTIFGCLIPIVVVVILGWMGFKKLGQKEPPVTLTVTAARGDVEIVVTENGTVEPLRSVEVKSKVAGRLSKLYVDENAVVTPGQALADIDPTEINSQVEQIRAQLDAARARYEQAIKAVSYQKDQTANQLNVDTQALNSAEARYKSAVEENNAQPALTESDIASAEASLKTAKNSLSLLKASTHPQAVVAAETGYIDAKTASDNSKRNLDRQQRLFTKGFVSELVIDQAKSDLAAQEARRDQAKKRLDLISDQNRLEIANAESHVKEAEAALMRAKTNRSIINVKKHDLDAAAAAVKQSQSQVILAKRMFQQGLMKQDDVRAAKAGVMQLEQQLRENQVHQFDTKIIAPMAGVVTRRYIETGELVTSAVGSFSNGTPVMRVSDLSKMLVKISVNEVDVHKVRVGLPVDISVDGVKDVKFAGRVSKLAPASIASGAAGSDGNSQASSGNSGQVIRFAVEVIIDHPDKTLRPGMTAKCTIVMARKKNVVRVPVDCVTNLGKDATVQIHSQTIKDGKSVDVWTPRKIVTGLKGDSHIEIVSGLKENEKIKPGAFNGPPRAALEFH